MHLLSSNLSIKDLKNSQWSDTGRKSEGEASAIEIVIGLPANNNNIIISLKSLQKVQNIASRNFI